MILAGDIGGTKTNVALFSEDLTLLETRSFPSQNYPGLSDIIEEFLNGRNPDFSSVCFGVAGPVVNGKSSITNLTWKLDTEHLKQPLKCQKISLINDLEANGYGIEVLPDSAFSVLREGVQAQGNAALISAGTGLGECCLFWDGKKFVPSASEGGHVSFSPRNEEEIDLLRYMWKTYPHVSWERIVSGSMGFKNIYSFFRDTGRAIEPPDLAEQLATHEHGSGAIIHAAAEQGIEIAVKTMKLFVSLYGAEAGNLALKIMATGGMYIGGGIAPKILKWMNDGDFLDSFSAKGRFTSILERIPVKIILDSNAALFGAARYAQVNLSKAV